jgi:hypothetical protein
MIGVCLLSTHIVSAQADGEGANALKKAKRSIGIKAGASYSLMPAFKSFSVSDNFGFFAGGYIAPPSASRVGFRSELLLTRQGYDYASSRQTGNVMLTYLMLPQLATVRITPFLELQAGPQLALLLSATVDSSANASSAPNLEKAKDYFNRLNYGVAAGFELFPSRTTFIGARYNLFFDMWKGNATGSVPDYVPDYGGNVKSGLLQLYLGLRF